MFQDRIEKLKNDFVRVEEDIEREAAELEDRERKILVKSQPPTVDEPSSPPSEDQVPTSREGKRVSVPFTSLTHFSRDLHTGG